MASPTIDNPLPMFAVMVRCYEHWFVPFIPDTEKQCVFTSAKDAERMADRLQKERPKQYASIKVVAA